MHFQTVIAITLSSACASVLAQAYPGKPVRIIVPFSAGGGTDTVARFVAQKLSAAL